MTRRETYLDWNATAPLRPEAGAAVVAALGRVGNASSVHRWGRAARQSVERARAAVAAMIGAAPEGVVFVSGGTEANHLALLGAGRERVLVSAVEHSSVRAAGKLPLAAADIGADFVSLSAHKLGGPPGTGALVVTGTAEPAAMIRGGRQERGRRAGSENLPGIAGFAAAAEAAAAGIGEYERVRQLRDTLEAAAIEAAPCAAVIGADVRRLPNTTALALPGVPAETQVIALDLAGVMVSAGAACSSGKVGPSHVLAAMGVSPEIAAATIRVSLGWTTTEADIAHFLDAWTALARRLSRRAA